MATSDALLRYLWRFFGILFNANALLFAFRFEEEACRAARKFDFGQAADRDPEVLQCISMSSSPVSIGLHYLSPLVILTVSCLRGACGVDYVFHGGAPQSGT